jgi:hypothetical protein
MPITLNYTTVESADDAGNWSTVGDGAGIADSSYPSKEGSQCIEWEMKNSSEGGVVNKNAVTPFDISVNEVSIWFLNPVVDEDGAEVIDNTTNAGLYIRLYSGSNWADYYQTQHRKVNGSWRGGWLYCRASGTVGDEDRNSGTWGTAQVTSVDKVAIMVKSGGGDNTQKNSAKFGTDWSKYYDKIIISGDNSGVPYTLQDIFSISEDKSQGGGVWGCVDRAETYYSVSAGIDFGDGASGSFVMENEYLFFNQFSTAQKQHINIKNNFNFRAGVYSNGYSNSGCDIVNPNRADFIIDAGANVEIYATEVQGYDDLTMNGDCSVIGCDLFNNLNLYLNNSNIIFENNRVYYDSASKAKAGVVNLTPSVFNNISVFQTTDGLQFNQNATLVEYNASGNDYDLVVKDGVTVNVKDGIIDNTKLKRVV